ncbi:MAG: hypothetical protein J0L94_01160 [Rhodothermia bacterium]|nr:hypothetical protein [Rhodothermia bacterium]
MARKRVTIIAPNEHYEDTYLGVSFVGGKGETSDPKVVKLMRLEGFVIEEQSALDTGDGGGNSTPPPDIDVSP